MGAGAIHGQSPQPFYEIHYCNTVNLNITCMTRSSVLVPSAIDIFSLICYREKACSPMNMLIPSAFL